MSPSQATSGTIHLAPFRIPLLSSRRRSHPLEKQLAPAIDFLAGSARCISNKVMRSGSSRATASNSGVSPSQANSAHHFKGGVVFCFAHWEALVREAALLCLYGQNYQSNTTQVEVLNEKHEAIWPIEPRQQIKQQLAVPKRNFFVTLVPGSWLTSWHAELGALHSRSYDHVNRVWGDAGSQGTGKVLSRSSIRPCEPIGVSYDIVMTWRERLLPNLSSQLHSLLALQILKN